MLFPVTLLGHLSVNMQKMQHSHLHNKHLQDTLIDLNNKEYNFWYEYYHFIHNNEVYFFWLNRPGKFDELLNCQFYKINYSNGNKEYLLNTTIDKKKYKSYVKNNTQIVEIKTDKIEYKLVINIIDNIKKVYINTYNLNIFIDGKITSKDHYGGISILSYYFPLLPKYLIKLAGKSDIYPYEYLNDTFCIAESNIYINNIKEINISWFDRYIGNGYYYMTHYLWTMNYSKNWNIFILFYTDYPYKGLVVSFFYDKINNKTIECSNFWPNNKLNKMFVGNECNIDTYKTKLCDNTFKYTINYKSPKIECKINSIKIFKALDGFPLYERLSKNKNYNDGEEIHSVAEQLVYHEFSGESEVEIIYKNKIFKEKSITIIHGVTWKNCSIKPIGYNKKIFQDTFYVKHPNKDILNKKLN